MNDLNHYQNLDMIFKKAAINYSLKKLEKIIQVLEKPVEKKTTNVLTYPVNNFEDFKKLSFIFSIQCASFIDNLLIKDDDTKEFSDTQKSLLGLTDDKQDNIYKLKKLHQEVMLEYTNLSFEKAYEKLELNGFLHNPNLRYIRTMMDKNNMDKPIIKAFENALIKNCHTIMMELEQKNKDNNKKPFKTAAKKIFKNVLVIGGISGATALSVFLMTGIGSGAMVAAATSSLYLLGHDLLKDKQKEILRKVLSVIFIKRIQQKHTDRLAKGVALLDKAEAELQVPTSLTQALNHKQYRTRGMLYMNQKNELLSLHPDYLLNRAKFVPFMATLIRSFDNTKIQVLPIDQKTIKKEKLISA